MFIELKSINQICYGGLELSLSGNILRYIDFENTSVLLLKNDNTRLVFIAVVTDGDGVTKLSIIKEFQFTGHIVGFRKVIYNDKEVLNLRVDDLISIINPDNGEIINEFPTKGKMPGANTWYSACGVQWFAKVCRS